MAGIKISQLTPGGTIQSIDELPISRAGVETYKILASQIVTDGANVGNGSAQFFADKITTNSTTLRFRSLSGDEGISFQNVDGTIVVSTSGQNPIKTTFYGNGSTLTFPINGNFSVNPNNYRVDIDGVLQEPIADYNVVGSNIIFTSAPPLSSKIVVVSNNIVRAYDIIPSDGSVTDTKVAINAAISGSKIAPGSITNTQIAINADISGSKIASNSITNTQIAINAAISGSKITPNFANQQIVTTNSVVGSAINAYTPTGLMSRVNLSSINGTHWTISNYGTQFAPNSAFAIADETNAAVRFLINSSGNIGIGILTPTLNTNGTVLHIHNSTPSRGSAIHLTNAESGAASNNGFIIGKWSNGTNYISEYGTYPIVFGTSGIDRVKIHETGSLFVGYAGGGSVNYEAGIVKAAGYNTKAGYNGTLQPHIFNIDYSTPIQPRLYIDVTDLGIITTSSDYRIKRNITDLPNIGIQKIKQLRPVNYQYKAYNNLSVDEEKVRTGFIAHELAEVIPDAVDGNKDEENKIQSLKLDSILAVLVKAVQELTTQIEAQTQTISTLENRLSLLEAKN